MPDAKSPTRKLAHLLLSRVTDSMPDLRKAGKWGAAEREHAEVLALCSISAALIRVGDELELARKERESDRMNHAVRDVLRSAPSPLPTGEPT